MNRRTFVKTTALSTASLSLACQSNLTQGIIDTHTHFYDPTRPEGIPWPGKKSPLYRKVYPADFMKVASPFGVTGTVVVEASNVLEDNQWILDLAKENKSIVGFIGNVDPTIDDWGKHIRRFAKDPIFRGVRLKTSANKLGEKSIIRSLKLMRDLGLCVDLNGNPKGLLAAAQISKSIPDMRIIVEHLPGRHEFKSPAVYSEALKTVEDLPNVYVKVSSVLIKNKGKTITDPSYYTQGLDHLWDTFGEDRVIYGSNWPVSDVYNGTYAEVFNVVDTYFTAKGLEARNKYFAGNASKAYKWIKR